MIRMGFLFFALLGVLTGQAVDDGEHWLDARGYTDVARWMIEQPDPEMRAAGLLVLAQPAGPETAIEPARFMDEVESLLDGDPAAAAVFMIAQGCRQIDLLEACAQAGVPAAVDRLDGSNPFAVGLFHDPESSGFRQMLISAQHIDGHYPEIASAWFEALIAKGPDDMELGAELVIATGIALASAVPRAGAIVDRCQSAVGTDETLDRACQRLSEHMRTSGRTLIVNSLGYGMAQRRAEQMGDEALAAEYERKSQTVMPSGVCHSESADEALATDLDAQRRFLAEMRAHGEESALRMLHDEYGSGCEDEPE